MKKKQISLCTGVLEVSLSTYGIEWRHMPAITQRLTSCRWRERIHKWYQASWVKWLLYFSRAVESTSRSDLHAVTRQTSKCIRSFCHYYEVLLINRSSLRCKGSRDTWNLPRIVRKHHPSFFVTGGDILLLGEWTNAVSLESAEALMSQPHFSPFYLS